MTGEGNLEAPIRHPVPWKSADFWDRVQAEGEMTRIFDICQGCRRCFNLCQAFPLLFDAVDATPSGKVEEVANKVMWEVVDHCYLCDLCYMTKCPYTPPHPFNLDFPHTMLRAKAIQFRAGNTRWRDKLLASTDALGRLATIPIVVDVVNAVNQSGFTRTIMHHTLGIHRDRHLPVYASPPLRRRVVPNESFTPRPGVHTPGKVALFATCYANFNEPGIGLDLLKILEHNEIPVRWVTQEKCCGMPRLELGDLAGVEVLKNQNIPVLDALAQDGYALLAPVPSCVLMFKQELPLLFPEDEAVARVARAFFDPFEYFMDRHGEGLWKTDFSRALGRISYHVPCHLRVQNIGLRTRDLLQMIPGTTVTTVERCSGHDGTWGVKVEFFETSMKIGKPVFSRMKDAEPDVVVSDCPIATRHIVQGMGEAVAQAHPLTLLRRAYGLPEE